LDGWMVGWMVGWTDGWMGFRRIPASLRVIDVSWFGLYR
jgi:hypothetical protein